MGTLPCDFQGNPVTVRDRACHRAGAVRERGLPGLEELDDLLRTLDLPLSSQLVVARVVGERASQEQNPTGTAIRAGLAQERYYSTWGYGDTPAPVRRAPGSRPSAVLGIGASVLASSELLNV